MSDGRNASWDPDWIEKYRDVIATPEQAVSHIRPGHRVFIGTGCAQPLELVRALSARSSELTDTEIVHLLTFGEAPYADRKLVEHFRVNSFFIAENVRNVIQEGLGDYTPIFLSEIPHLFASGQLPIDAALIQVTPPDASGMCSLGISVDIIKSAVENASLVIAQVNPRMPRTFGDSLLHILDIDVLVPVDEPIVEVVMPEPNFVTRKIGEHVASLVEDGSTLEVGIGRIPQAVLGSLGGKRNIGIHTEMFTDSIIDLIESGVITDDHKSTDHGKIVASFCMGTRKLYDYVDGNPRFSFRRTEYVNDSFVIAQQNKMVAINVALEVDLTGQVCADSIGSKFFSGIGGQANFTRGAARAVGGKPIIALPSTACDGQVSRIVSTLSPGAGVVTTRGDVHYVITEYGIAYLHGKRIQERAMALISIAHPDFRSRLIEEAIEAKFIRPEHADVRGKVMSGPQELLTTMLLDDGTQVYFRPIHPTDEQRMRPLFHKLSQATVYYRFMSNLRTIPQRLIQDFVYVDHRRQVAIVGTLPEAHGEDIIAVGHYYLDQRTNRAEIAMVVQDEWQNRGLGKFLLRHLIKIARRNGIGGMTAEVLPGNKPMLALINGSGCRVTSTLHDDVVSLVLDFD
jgi:acyl-CoA hydrolase/GNAT superfamily N-acetyltransferase